MTNATEELPIGAQNVEGAPVSLAGASIQTIRFDQISPAPATPEDAIRYRISLTVHLTNNTDRIMTGLALRITGLKQLGKSRVVNYFDSIAARLPFSFRKLVSDGQISLENAAEVRVKIVGVRFEDGTAWGSNPPGPYPPPVPQSHPTGNPPGLEGLPEAGAPSSQPSDQPPSSADPVPSPSPSDLPKIIRKSGGVLHSSAITRVLPSYPEEAKAAGISGGVSVEIVIDEEGKVEKATAISGPGALRGAAVEAARQWRWNPTTLSGAPVKVTGTLAFGFAL